MKMKGKLISLISVIFILFVGMVMGRCARESKWSASRGSSTITNNPSN